MPPSTISAFVTGLTCVLVSVLVGCAAPPAPMPRSSSPPEPVSASPSRTIAPSSAPISPAPQPSTTPTSAAAGDLLLVTAFAASHLAVVDPDEGEIARIEVGTAPWGVAVAPDGLAYVATHDGVAIVDVEARRRHALVPYASVLSPEPMVGEYRSGGLGIAVSPDGARAYVGVTTRFPDPGVLEVIDIASREVIASIGVGIRQFDVVVSADGTEVYAINHDSFDVTVIDAVGLDVVRTLRAAPLGDERGLGSWNKPHYASLTDEGTLLMAYKGVLVLELNPATGASSTFPLRSATHSQGVELAQDGRHLLVVGDGPDDTSLAGPSLEIVDRRDGSSVVVPLQGSHNDAVVSTDGRFAYVTGGSSREGTPYPDVVTTVDLDRSEVIGSHPVAGNPLIIARWPAR